MFWPRPVTMASTIVADTAQIAQICEVLHRQDEAIRINAAKTWQDRYALHPVSLLERVEGVNLHPEDHNGTG